METEKTETVPDIPLKHTKVDTRQDCFNDSHFGRHNDHVQLVRMFKVSLNTCTTLSL